MCNAKVVVCISCLFFLQFFINSITRHFFLIWHRECLGYIRFTFSGSFISIFRITLNNATMYVGFFCILFHEVGQCVCIYFILMLRYFGISVRGAVCEKFL